MGQTATYLLPYPEVDEPDDVPADVKQLCDRLELVLPGFQATSAKGAVNGYAGLDATGKVPTAQLPAIGGPTVLRKTTEKDVVNTVALTDLLNAEVTIPAAAMTSGGRLRLVAAGDYLNNSGVTKGLRLRVRLGGTTLWDATSSGTIIPTDANRCAWTLTLIIQALGSTIAQRASGLFVLGYANVGAAATGTGGMAGGPSILAPFLGVASTLDMVAASRAVTFEAAHSAAHASTSIRLEHAYVEVT